VHIKKSYDKLLAVILIVFGILAMGGWILKAPILTPLRISFVLMAFYSAVCFVALGCSLLLIDKKSRACRVAFWGGIVVVLVICLLTLTDHILHNYIILEQLFMHYSDDSFLFKFPGRMTFKTTICFLIVLITMILLTFRQCLWVRGCIQILCMAIFITGLTGIFNYFMDTKLLEIWDSYAPMSAHASICFILLSLALWFNWYKKIYTDALPNELEERRLSTTSATILVVIVLMEGISVFAVLQNAVVTSAEEKLRSMLETNANMLEDTLSQAIQKNKQFFNYSAVKKLLQAHTSQREMLKETIQELASIDTISFQIFDVSGRLMLNMGEKETKSDFRIPLNHTNFVGWAEKPYLETHHEITVHGKVIGYGVIQQHINYINKIINFDEGLGSTGEIRICAAKDEEYMSCLPSRNWPTPEERIHRIQNGRPLIMDYALKGKEGIIKTDDYRKKFVIAAYKMIQPYRLGMLLKIDASEFFQVMEKKLNQILVVLIILISVGVLLLRYQWMPILKRVFTADREVRESDKRFRALFEYSSDAYLLMDHMGVIDCNRAALSLLHCGNKMSLLSISLVDLSPEFQPDGQSSIKKYAEIEYRVQEKGYHKFDWTFLKFDETLITVEVTLNSVILNDHNVILVLWHDLTERKKYEQELLASQDHLQAIMNASYHSIIATDLKGIITQINRTAERMLGYSALEVVNRESLMLFHQSKEIEEKAKKCSDIHGRLILPNFEVFTLALSGKADVIEGEYTYVRKDKSEFPVLLSVTPLRGINDELTGYLGTAVDISEQKALEKLKNEFISTVSHELRTPLTSIRGALSLILNGVAGTMSEQMKSLIEIAQKNCERLILLINDILDIDKITSGQMRFNFQWFDIRDLVLQSIELNREYGQKYQVQFIVQEPLPSSQIFVDKDRFIQVMTNLLSNAAKFSSPNSIVDVVVTEDLKTVRVAVIDYGMGIPDEFRGRIFGKFAQADSSDSRQKGGTGLGLNISKTIIDHFGGKIDFTSEVGKKTVFYFDLERSSDALISESSKQEVSRRKLLICEQDKELALTLREKFVEVNFDVDVAFNLWQAKELLKQDRYKCCILDASISDETLHQFLKEIHELHPQRHLPIIMISSQEKQNNVLFDNYGGYIVDWISKPLDLANLDTTVKYLCKMINRPVILHVEDDRDISELISVAMRRYATVIHVTTIANAKEELREKAIDLVLLDISLPDGSALKLLEEKTIPLSIPIIILSATEIPPKIKKKVAATLVKTKHSDVMIIETIKSILLKQES